MVVAELVKAIARIPIRIILASICLSSAFLLFAPQKFLRLLMVQDIHNNFAQILGLGLITSASLLFVLFIVWAYNYIHNALQYSGRDARRRIDAAGDWGKSLIRQLYETPSHAQKLPLQNANVNALIALNILGRAELGNMAGFDCVLQPWVVKYLDAHPKYVAQIIKFDKPFVVQESPFAFTAGYQ